MPGEHPPLLGTGDLSWEPLPHGGVSVHSVAFLPYMETVFEEVFTLLEVSGAGGGAGGVWGLGAVTALHAAHTSCPSSCRSALT